MIDKAKDLRKLILDKEILVAPGCIDCLSAKVIEDTGFKVAYITGHGLSVSLIGKTDVGFTTMTEVMTAAKNISNSINIPTILDIDTGYGGPINVIRTIKEAECAGVAAVQIEDQSWPKKCGHMEGRRVISTKEMINKIKAAADARKTELVIIARTDAAAVYGIEEAIDRLNAYIEAGADVGFVDGITSKEDLLKTAREVKGPTQANMVEGGRTPIFNAKELEQMGYSIVIYPMSVMYAGTKNMFNLCQYLIENNETDRFLNDGKMFRFDDFNKFMGLEEFYKTEKKYAD